MESKLRFFAIGLIVAFLEEFITQGVLKRNLLGWIAPTIIAFVPFLISVRLVRGFLHKRLEESQAVLAHYLVAGAIGLMIEWFVIGLSPWSNPGANPLLMLAFQLGIFSFWGSVGFAPELLLDNRGSVVRVRKWYKRFLILGFSFIYVITLSAPRDAQFVAGIGSVLVIFLSLNPFYFKYIRNLEIQQSPSVTAGGGNAAARKATPWRRVP